MQRRNQFSSRVWLKSTLCSLAGIGVHFGTGEFCLRELDYIEAAA